MWVMAYPFYWIAKYKVHSFYRAYPAEVIPGTNDEVYCASR